MKNKVKKFFGISSLIIFSACALSVYAAAPTTWDTTGSYVITMEYNGSNYDHDMNLVQNTSGQLSGNGGSPAGAHVYEWTIQNGTVVDDAIAFTALYTATPDAVTPQTTMDVNGVIASDGTMSGTWSDNYAGGSRNGTWTTASGAATKYPVVEEPSTVTVTIDKFVQGNMATLVTTHDHDFPMSATWNAANIGAGTGSYSLGKANTVPYEAVTAEMNKGASYATNEMVDSSVVGASCAEEKPFALQGYTSGETLAEAMGKTPSMTVPSFTDMQTSKYVIVWNHDCSLPEGSIGGDVVGEDGVLQVTSIEMVDTTAKANGSFTDGWEYVFHITAPESEPDLAMKFSDWVKTSGSGVIPVANNMRISSAQANNGGATVLLTAANTYSTPDLHMTGDLDPATAGRQVEVKVEVAVPTGTPNGSYTTSYGVRSN